MRKILFALTAAAAFVGAGTTTTKEAHAQTSSFQIVSGGGACLGTSASVALKNRTFSFMTGSVFLQVQNDAGRQWSGWLMSNGQVHKAALVAGGQGTIWLPLMNTGGNLVIPNWVRVYIDGYGWSNWAHSTCLGVGAAYF
jgi:hypothetical protein